MATTKNINDLITSQSFGWTDALISRLAANSFGLGGRLSITAPANASALSTTGYSLTGSNASSMIDLAGEWNTSGTPTLIKANVTNTASNAASLLLDLQKGGVSQFSVDRNGSVSFGGANGGGDYVTEINTNSSYLDIKQGSNFAANFNASTSNGPGLTIPSNLFIAFGSASNLSSPLNTQDVILARDAANTLALRNAANAQAFNIYNTYTSGSVYERGFMRWVGDVLKIGTEAVGGTVRNLRLFGGPTAPGVIQFENSVVIVGPMLGLGVSQGDISPSASAFFYTPSNGVLRITDSTQANFNRLQFGGTTSSFPALKRSSTVLQARLADDSDFAPFAASTLALTTPVNTSALSSTGYSLTGSNASSMIDLAGTWNTTGNPVALKIAMSNTASGATTKFLSCLAGASGTTEVFSVGKDGVVLGPNIANAFADTLETNSGFGFSSGNPLVQKAGTSIASALSSGWQVLALSLGATIGSPDTFAVRDAANTLALRNSTNAQAFNVYNTYTSGSVYERGFVRWVSNVLEIGTEHVGGSARSIALKTNGTNRIVIDGATTNLTVTSVSQIFLDSTTYFASGSAAGSRVAVANGVTVGSAFQYLFSSTSGANGAADVGLARTIAGVVGVTNGSTGAGALGLVEMTSPAAPATNGVYIFAEDNGSGKTRLMARFATGATQQLAIEP